MRKKLNKKECCKFAQPKVKFDPQAGIFHCEQVKYVVTAAVKNIDRHRTLIISFFPAASVAAGNISAKYVLFQTKQDFLTLEYQADGKTRWRVCDAESLEGMYSFLDKCAFYQSKDEEIVKKYCNGAEKKGLTALNYLQHRIQDVKQFENRQIRLQRIVRRMDSVPQKPHDLNGYIHNTVMPQFIFYDYQKTKKPIEGFCTACSHTVMITGQKHLQQRICPRCGHKILFRSRGRKRYFEERETAQVIQKVSDNELIIRFFKICDRYLGKDTPVRSVYECQRVFLSWNKDLMLNYDWYHNTNHIRDITSWRKGKLREYIQYNYNYWGDVCGYLYLENLDTVLQHTPFQYSQLKQFCIQLDDSLQVIPYLYTYAHHPALEYLVKLKLTRLAGWAVYSNSDYVNGKKPIDLQGKNLREVLGLTREHLPFLQRVNPGAAQMILIRELIYNGKKPDEDLIKWCSANNVTDASRVNNLLQYMSTMKLIRYVDEQFAKYRRKSGYQTGHLFSMMNDVIIAYSDYVVMCEGLECDLSNEFVLYPKNLPEAHDRINELSDEDVSALYDKVITSRYEKLKKRYGFEKGEFMIIPPQTAKEIVEEGNNLRHCVGRYVKKVVLNESVILFMRKASEPDKSYCTIELIGDSVQQARIQQNADPPPKAKAFLSLWKSTVVEAPLAEAA